MTGRAARGSHVPELDGIRGVAILMVLALHFVCSQIPAHQNKLELVLARLTGYGAWGVDLFFVLSGYLITGILWDMRGSNAYFRTFFVRRTLRIFPLYYATLLIFTVLIPDSFVRARMPEVLTIRELQPWLWTYLTNVWVAQHGFEIPYISHFWTLAIEQHFYLFWPFVVGLLPLTTVRRICVGASLFALCSRLVLDAAGFGPFYAHVLTPCRLDALCIGSWFALAARGDEGLEGLAQRAQRWFWFSAAGVLVTSAVHSLFARLHAPAESFRLVFLALFFGCCIVLVAAQNGPAWAKALLRARWLTTLGKYSYGLYVFHGILASGFARYSTIEYFQRLAGSHTLAILLQALFGTALSILIAVISYEAFEKHFLKLKKRFEAVQPAAVRS